MLRATEERPVSCIARKWEVSHKESCRQGTNTHTQTRAHTPLFIHLRASIFILHTHASFQFTHTCHTCFILNELHTRLFSFYTHVRQHKGTRPSAVVLQQTDAKTEFSRQDPICFLSALTWARRQQGARHYLGATSDTIEDEAERKKGQAVRAVLLVLKEAGKKGKRNTSRQKQRSRLDQSTSPAKK